MSPFYVHVSDGEGDQLAVWRGIEEFLAVTASGSFTAAAEKLGVCLNLSSARQSPI